MHKKKTTAREQVRASQRDISSGVRDLERQALQLKGEEARLVKEIKAAAAKGNQPVTRQLAKSLVRIRQQTAGATSTVAASMQKASQAMAAMGQAVDPRAMQQSMAEFARENQRMNMASDMMGDAIDNAFEDDEEESQDIMNQVLDEIGIDVSTKLGAVPLARTGAAAPAAAETKEDAELRRALAALKG